MPPGRTRADGRVTQGRAQRQLGAGERQIDGAGGKSIGARRQRLMVIV
jgi:hypothetical protein